MWARIVHKNPAALFVRLVVHAVTRAHLVRPNADVVLMPQSVAAATDRLHRSDLKPLVTPDAVLLRLSHSRSQPLVTRRLCAITDHAAGEAPIEIKPGGAGRIRSSSAVRLTRRPARPIPGWAEAPRPAPG